MFTEFSFCRNMLQKKKRAGEKIVKRKSHSQMAIQSLCPDYCPFSCLACCLLFCFLWALKKKMYLKDQLLWVWQKYKELGEVDKCKISLIQKANMTGSSLELYIHRLMKAMILQIKIPQSIWMIIKNIACFNKMSEFTRTHKITVTNSS